MSGHSKWSTIKRQKGVNDQARGNLFSKLGKAISIAAREGANPESNYKLKIAIAQAKDSNMPKTNIERAIASAQDKQDVLKEVLYEGFGPGGVGLLIETSTDNRNRTGQEIKFMLEKHGGNLGSPGSVSFNFESRGLLLVSKKGELDDQVLTIMDVDDVLDVEESSEGIEVYVIASKLFEVKKRLEEKRYIVVASQLIRVAKAFNPIAENKVQALKNLLENISDHADVLHVFASAEF